MVLLQAPSGGAVFSVGSISWCGSLSHNKYDNSISQITENVLRRFAATESTDGSETPYQQKINQALKIVRAAVAASETDPEQAMRAMVTQANAIQSIATDFKLTLAASEFYRHLSKCAHSGGKFSRAEAERWAAPLLTFLPKDSDAGRGQQAAAA